MARTNKTDNAILGLLSLEPMSGYDIKQFVSKTIGFFWQESYGQIYPALKRLHTAKYVTRSVGSSKGRQNRHLYSITPKGREQLKKWLNADTEPEQLRIELLLKLFFGPTAPPEVSIRQVEDLLKHQLGRLEAFKGVEKGILKQYEGSPYYPYWRSTLRFGVHVTTARVAWCRETIRDLKKTKSTKRS